MTTELEVNQSLQYVARKPEELNLHFSQSISPNNTERIQSTAGPPPQPQALLAQLPHTTEPQPIITHPDDIYKYEAKVITTCWIIEPNRRW